MSKIWTTMTWAVCDGDTFHLCWLFVPFSGGERLRGGVVGPVGAWRGTPTVFREMEAQSWVPQQRVQWDTPMARWAGEGKDWIQLMTHTRPLGTCSSR